MVSRFLASRDAQLQECIRLLSVKDPIAFAQVGQAVASFGDDGSTDMAAQFRTDEQMAKEYAEEFGVDLEEMREDEFLSDVKPGGF